MEKSCVNCIYRDGNLPMNMWCYICLQDARRINWKLETQQVATETGTTETAKLTTIEALQIILDDKYELAKRKNADYGDSVASILDKFKESGRNPHLSIYTRLADKFYRYENLLFNGNQKVNDESINDTLMDLSNYIDLFMAWNKSREVK